MEVYAEDTNNPIDLTDAINLTDPDVLSDLADADDLTPAQRERFVVDNDRKAEWCIGKIREAEDRKLYWKSFYESRLRRELEACESTIRFMKSRLEQFLLNLPAPVVKITKTQMSYPLPGGKIVLRKKEPKYTPDEPALLDFLKANGLEQCIRVEEKAQWGELKKLVARDESGRIVLVQTDDGPKVVTEEGVVVPCVKVEPQPDELKVE